MFRLGVGIMLLYLRGLLFSVEVRTIMLKPEYQQQTQLF